MTPKVAIRRFGRSVIRLNTGTSWAGLGEAQSPLNPDVLNRLHEKLDMAIQPILRMGGPRLLESAQLVEDVRSAVITGLIEDLFDTMRSAGGVGLAAPQIGVGLQVVIFGFDKSGRYPDAEPVPETILINPVITPLTEEEVLGWEGCLSVPGLRGEVPRCSRIR